MIRVPVGVQEGALLVPDRALGADQAGKYLLVVNAEKKVERRDVTVGAKHGELMVIEEGLGADERVVIDLVELLQLDLVIRFCEIGIPEVFIGQSGDTKDVFLEAMVGNQTVILDPC